MTEPELIKKLANRIIETMRNVPEDISDLDYEVCQSDIGQDIITTVRKTLEENGHVFYE